MSEFLKRLGKFAAIQFALLALVLWSYHRQFPVDRTFLAASLDKASLIRTQASPRLIFVGGSSMAYGIDSGMVADACGRRPVNMGLHAGLGLKLMLAEVEPWVRAGDWIIVAPEYQQYDRHGGVSDFLVNLMEIDPRNAQLLTLDQWQAVLDDGVLRRLGKEVRAVLEHPTRFFDELTSARTRKWHSRAGFDSSGDMVAHLDAPRPRMIERVFALRQQPDAMGETAECLNRFARNAEGRGARVWYSHPPIPEPIYEQNRASLHKLEAFVAREVRIPRIDTVDEMVFPFDHFFDTWYHLARPGVELRTHILAERMRAMAESGRESSTQAPRVARRQIVADMD